MAQADARHQTELVNAIMARRRGGHCRGRRTEASRGALEGTAERGVMAEEDKAAGVLS